MSHRILRRPEVENLTGLSRSTIYRRLLSNSFPKPVPLGGRLVGWIESDIQAWLDARIIESKATKGGLDHE